MKKLIAFIGVSVLFSGATFINRANTNVDMPTKPISKVEIITQKVSKLDSLLIELDKYEKVNK